MILIQCALDDEEIEMELIVTVDATESSVDLEETNADVVADFESQGVSAESESNIFCKNHFSMVLYTAQKLAMEFSDVDIFLKNVMT